MEGGWFPPNVSMTNWCQLTWPSRFQLWTQRTFLGSMMGSLESWLLLRSLRTLHLRVPRQSENAYELAQWLSRAANVGCRLYRRVLD